LRTEERCSECRTPPTCSPTPDSQSSACGASRAFGRLGRIERLDIAHEAKAALADGPDQALPLAVVADRLPRRLHAA